MKNYKDMADAVFARRDEYVASVKRKKKIALNASLSLCAICLAVMGAFGIWKTGILEPDPNVIGTKPQSFTEPTASTLHSFGSNATSEGKSTETTELVSGNTRPQNSTDGNVNPTEESKPKSTDPAENVTSPAVRPDLPVVRPTLPTLPTLPVRPDTPSLDGKPDVPPTSGDNRYPQTQTPVVTDPVENEPGNENPSDQDVPDVVLPTVPAPPTTAQPTTKEPDFPAPDEPVYTEPCTQAPMEPTDVPCAPETQAPQDPTDPIEESPGIPPTSVEVNRVEGKVVDQYGNPVSGAVVKVYSRGMVVGSYTTNSNGYYFMSGFRTPDTIKVVSVPSGYTLSGLNIGISKGYNYIELTCNKK